MTNINKLSFCHLIFTSHKEVLFRNSYDVGIFLNCIALAAYATQTRILADAEMSTHCHIGILSPKPTDFCRSTRIRYSKYFNHKYNRKNRFGDVGCYMSLMNGPAHICTAISYILRNGLHHGISSTAFGYPYCSVNTLFSNDLRRTNQFNIISARNEISSFLPRNSRFPDYYIMSDNGVFLRESFEEVQLVESFYVSPRAFLYNMNRLSSEEWIREQEKDGNECTPVTLQSMELVRSESEISAMLRAERGHAFINKTDNDFNLCETVDNNLLRKFHKSSVYDLSIEQKRRIANILQYDLKATQSQISRILALEYNQ